METTHETDPTDVYDDDLYQLRRNPRRLIACGLAATLAVLAVVVVVRGGADEPVKVTPHPAVTAPSGRAPLRKAPPTTSASSDDADGFFGRVFGDRLDGLGTSDSSPAGGESDAGSYEVNGCPFDLQVPDDWDTSEMQGVFVSARADDGVAVDVACRVYDGTPLEQMAEAVRAEVPGLGKVRLLSRGPVEQGYRLELRTEDDLHLRVTWIVSGDSLYSVIEVYVEGDDTGAATAHQVGDSFRLSAAS
jgi:hypothetical protein